jgi:UDP-N-acetyl-D-mannosaminuronic acid dehydrogenase
MGYIGLPTSAVLASRGHQIHGVDTSPTVRDAINSGHAHIVEPDLDMLVQAGVQSGRLKANEAPAEADVFMLCVQTPVSSDHDADLSYVKSAARSICSYLRPGNLVILESTSPPGTTELIAEIVEEETALTRHEVLFVHAPERVLPGQILREVIQNDRILGGLTDEATAAAVEFYGAFVTGKLVTTDSRTAEMAKLVENASRDVQIAFANELSILCEDLNIDVRELITIANHHPRVNILQPGCGVGGHCIAVDPWFIVHRAQGKARLIETARAINMSKPDWVVDKVKAAASKLRDPVIACFGVTYKPDIDDTRESPAMEILEALTKADIGKILVVDPYLETIEGHTKVTAEDARAQADIFVFLVGHAPFRKFSSTQLAEKIVIDTCGIVYTPRSSDA